MKSIAFFCAEYAVENELGNYAGGLGVLAGDYLFEAGSTAVPFYAFGLFYHHGFVSDENNTVNIDPTKSGFSILTDANNDALFAEVELDSRLVQVQVWTKDYGSARLFLLDTNVVTNTPEDREITARLYDPPLDTRMTQQLILGVGAVQILGKLKIKPDIYHLNEGHMSFVIMALALEQKQEYPDITLEQALDNIRGSIVATKHTVLTTSGMYFQKEEFESLVKQYLNHHKVEFDEFFQLGTGPLHPDLFATTHFLLQNSIRRNGVSKLHIDFEKQVHPNSTLFPITNGINPDRWLDSSWKTLKKDGRDFETLNDDVLWNTHQANRRELIKLVNDITGSKLKSEALTVVWARRITAYKRPGLIFADKNRLLKLLNHPQMPMQIIFAGQANAGDTEAQQLIRWVSENTKEPDFKDKVVYLPNYSLALAEELAAGADLWLNTPVRGREACGTSGMKAGLNGVLQFSTSDGWYDEVKWEGLGWVIPESGIEDKLYEIMSEEIVPSFYTRSSAGVPKGWTTRMRKTMNLINRDFTTTRMLKEYMEKLYFPITNKNHE